MANKMTLQEQANEILKRAEQKGVQSNFFFVTTFKRYQVQMKMLGDLERAINEDGVTVTKEYVKGRKNIVINPAIASYNATSTAANNTVKTLTQIVDSFQGDEKKESLADIMQGLMAE